MSSSDDAMISGMVQLRLGERKASLPAVLPHGTVALTALIPFAQRLSGTLSEWAEQDVRAQNKSISCGSGCAACCRLSVTVSRAEARHLAALVASLPEPRQSEIRRRYAEALRTLSETGLLPSWNRLCSIEHQDPERAAEAFEAWALEYFRLWLPCPFLADETCSIYADRPLICREYMVMSPAACCAAVGRTGWERIERVPLYASVAGAIDGMGHEVGDGGSIPLVAALEWAASTSDGSAPKPALEWAAQLLKRLQAKPQAATPTETQNP